MNHESRDAAAAVALLTLPPELSPQGILGPHEPHDRMKAVAEERIVRIWQKGNMPFLLIQCLIHIHIVSLTVGNSSKNAAYD